MKSIRHLKFCVLLLIFVILLGVSGYMTIEDWDFLDALYMTVTTLTTVGYGEVHEVSNLGRIFTILFIIIGVVLFFVYCRCCCTVYGRRPNQNHIREEKLG